MFGPRMGCDAYKFAKSKCMGVIGAMMAPRNGFMPEGAVSMCFFVLQGQRGRSLV